MEFGWDSRPELPCSAQRCGTVLCKPLLLADPRGTPRTVLMRPFEDGKHLPEPTWVLLGPATVNSHWRHAAVPPTAVIQQPSRLPDGSALQPRFLVSQGWVSWPHSVQPINPTLNFSLQMHPLICLDRNSIQIEQEKRVRPQGDFSGDAEDRR